MKFQLLKLELHSWLNLFIACLCELDKRANFLVSHFLICNCIGLSKNLVRCYLKRNVQQVLHTALVGYDGEASIPAQWYPVSFIKEVMVRYCYH